jgi:hypothetical protein
VRRLFAAIATAAVTVSVAPGCGSDMPPLLGADAPDSSSSKDAAPDRLDLLVESGPPSCKTGPEGGVCGCLDLPLTTHPPNLYFVLDHSGSMNDDDKWTTVQSSIVSLMTAIGPRANFGAALFPGPSGSDPCAVGVEVAPLRRGDSPSGTVGPTTTAMQAAIAIPASGGTPTAATFTSLTPHLASLQDHTYAILATDGGPDCDAELECGAGACTVNLDDDVAGCTPTGPNCCTALGYGSLSCLDSTATIVAVTALKAKGVPTYVIGVPGSEPYASVLDQIAQAGGTARSEEPYYYAVDTTDQAAFYDALSKIAAKVIATCKLPLGMAPPDPALVNVYLDGKVVPQSGPDGWTYADDTVTLLGKSCSEVLAGDVLDVRVVAGCPTIQK